MSASSTFRLIAAAIFVLCAAQLCHATKSEVDQSSPSRASETIALERENQKVENQWQMGAWWGKNRSGFRRGFFTGLCVAWFLGGSGLVLAVLSGFYTFASHFSWHAKVKGSPMLPLHRLGCA
eukprot:gnl/MRDRNA2_/MRDRNA2_115182_c0_seq1.p1 gnl/MRDRNA2_/MRDRNA2_115182_c0~~gnl/MRDRNA2_/MRDRNA2_115182_c0_seq1.p1  ORF type:complete len:123 (-),score=21.61 gnl/MRDRNA2_/MRDRNA2_115182_c0_seq1:539-907(-)